MSDSSTPTEELILTNLSGQVVNLHQQLRSALSRSESLLFIVVVLLILILCELLYIATLLSGLPPA